MEIYDCATSDRDAIFAEEQEHLTQTYAKLKVIEASAQASLDERRRKAMEERQNMLDELAVDFGNGVNLETYAEIEAVQRVVDEYSLANDIDSERLIKAHMLLHRPYFAKITVQLREGAEPRDVYLGVTGMVDENRRHFIIDWRAPIAEVYYNQSTGKTSYTANGRQVQATLLTRRQFDILEDKLNACFDTTVAIEDPLLLASLAKERSSKLSDITATIQREQNIIIRHEDVPVMLVNGIAGSGKTSVMLQRIAYLLFQERETLQPDQVHLISPNAVFRNYIDDVLPNMGERNPQIETWDDLLCKLGIESRGAQADMDAQELLRIDEALPNFKLEQRDFKDICIEDERVISAGQAFSAYQAYKSLPTGVHRCTLVMEELHDKLESRVMSRAGSEDVQGDLFDLDEQEQCRLFGHHIFGAEDEELRDYAETYLRDRYEQVTQAIEDGAWLRIDRIGMRLLGKSTLSAAEWLYLKLALAGGADRAARYVMIDEVQDYSQAQLMVLARYFCNAHFLLLGDENQAIKAGTATFSQVKDAFLRVREQETCECKLLTSYRSSPEITALFQPLMNADSRMDVSSVQREGTVPVIASYEDDAAYVRAVRQAVEEAAAQMEEGGLAAVIVAERQRAKWLAKQLEGASFVLARDNAALPAQGVVLLDLPLAKGLEFDQVIIADAQASVYGADDLSRHRLYTAISRATQKVTIFSQGPLTPLLS